MSYISEDVQKAVSELDKSVNTDMAVKLGGEGITAVNVKDIDCGVARKRKASVKTVKIPVEVYEKYFKGVGEDTAAEIMEQALVAWFGGKGVVVV